MATLHMELSNPTIGRNPLADDLTRMNGLYDSWKILIDDLSSVAIV